MTAAELRAGRISARRIATLKRHALRVVPAGLCVNCGKARSEHVPRFFASDYCSPKSYTGYTASDGKMSIEAADVLWLLSQAARGRVG